MARYMATLFMADLHPAGGPGIWSGNQIATSLSSRIPIQMDEDGCPMNQQPFPPYMFLLQKLAPLWEHRVHTWTQILGRAPYGRSYFFDERNLQWANPKMAFPFRQALTYALKYLRTLLSSTVAAHCRRLSKNMTAPVVEENPITPRWQSTMSP